MSDSLHVYMRWFHIAIGCLGLIAFWVPVVTRKGGKLHKAAGRWFVRAVYFVAGTAVISCAWALIHPASFVSSRTTPTAELVAQLQFFFGILGFLAVLSLGGAMLGVRTLRSRDNLDAIANLPIRAIFAAQLAASLALFGFGLWNLATNYAPQYYIALALGAVGVYDFFETRRFLRNPRESRMGWFYKHIECMIGCGVAFHTAATVTVFARVIQVELPGPMVLIPWLLPAAIGIPATHFTIRHYRKKFNDFPSKEGVAMKETAEPVVAEVAAPTVAGE